MEREHGLLRFGLDCNGFDSRLLNGYPDSSCICNVILVTACEGAHRLSREQFHGVPHGYKLAGPMLRPTTRLHADEAWLAIDEVLQETSALNLAAGNFSCFFVYLVNLEDALGYIDANDGLGKAHDDLSRWATELLALMEN